MFYFKQLWFIYGFQQLIIIFKLAAGIFLAMNLNFSFLSSNYNYYHYYSPSFLLYIPSVLSPISSFLSELSKLAIPLLIFGILWIFGTRLIQHIFILIFFILAYQSTWSFVYFLCQWTITFSSFIIFEKLLPKHKVWKFFILCIPLFLSFFYDLL